MRSDSICATGGRIAGPEPCKGESAELWDVLTVAAKLSCSARTIYRLADAGRMPPPRKLNSLVRWSRKSIETWIADGCPQVRTTRGGR
jgi:predicted DNA-binding transcriptional regulator AlpA